MALYILLNKGPVFSGELEKPCRLKSNYDILKSKDFKVHHNSLNALPNLATNHQPSKRQMLERQLSQVYCDGIDGRIPLKSCLYVPKGDSGEKVPIKKSKSVHFADSCGLALTSVLPFVNPDLDYDSLKDPVSKSRKSYPVFDKLKGRALGERESKSRLINFVQPISLPDFARLVDVNNVMLENVTFREYSIFGTIRVKNVSFEKSVLVKFTTDSWKSCQTLTASYLPGSSTGSTDGFSFELSVPEGNNDEDVKFEFCVCFESAGQEFWDNNFGDNYRLVCHRKSRPLNEVDGFVRKFSVAENKLIGWNI